MIDLLNILMNISPAVYLLEVSAVFTLVVISILLFIVYYLREKDHLSKTKARLRSLYSNLISEVSLCETEEEREQVMAQPYVQSIVSKELSKSLGRKILIKELVKSKDSLTGDAAQNLRWLYEKLSLDQDSFQRFSSKKWHVKSSGIQQLAEMGQAKYLVKIYRDTNSKNAFVRTEAQIAVVKLTGFKGLRFLNIVTHPVTQWQQLCLIDQLKETDIEPDKIKAWLLSTNETVVQFALRLIEVYKCFDLHEEAIACLGHKSADIRIQALRAIKEIATEGSFNWLWPHFNRSTKQEQLLLIEIFAELSTIESIRFLKSLHEFADETVQHKANSLLQMMNIGNENENDPSLTYLLSPLQKQVV
jgi:hypothetical protein